MDMAAHSKDAISAEAAGPGNRPPHLRVTGIWKTYGAGVPAVCDVSFDLERGRFLSLLGPSGSGKTSTLMMVAGFETPSRGAIEIDGVDIANWPARRRNLGVVFQSYALFPHMTVLENVMFPLRMRGVAPAERRRASLDMLEKVGLEQFGHRHPRLLSGGQQQRVALARALVFEPDALLLDEPLGALDRNLREVLQLEIKLIQRRTGITILYVTHDQEEAMMMSDHIAVMRGGRIVQYGDPSDVYLHPRSAFVAKFLGETNLVSCAVLGTEGETATVRFSDGSIGRVSATAGSGTPTSMSVRPERIEVVADVAGFENRFIGQVVERTFLGRHTRFVVEALGTRLIVSTPRLDLGHLVPGAPVVIAWSTGEAHLLAGE